MEIPWLQMLLVMVLLVDLSIQHTCEQCDCTISATDANKGVHLTTLTCMDGSVTWYNPIGALRVELRPEMPGKFQSCFIVETGDLKLKVSREAELNINSKSPSERNQFILNDNNLQPLVTSRGKSNEVCIQATNSVILYLEPEVDETLESKRVVFRYDLVYVPKVEKSPIEECRPCSEYELLKAYCSSDFVIVGSMESVNHNDEIAKTKIDIEVAQIIRSSGDHFSRLKRDSALQGTITAPRKCGVSKGDGLFLMTGRVRLGELTMGCAPYLDEWETIVNKAQLEGRLECARD